MAEAERDDFDLLDEVYLYIVGKRYSKDCTATRKRQIRKKAEKFVVNDGELFYLSRKDKQVSCIFCVKSVTNTFTI